MLILDKVSNWIFNTYLIQQKNKKIKHKYSDYYNIVYQIFTWFFYFIEIGVFLYTKKSTTEIDKWPH